MVGTLPKVGVWLYYHEQVELSDEDERIVECPVFSVYCGACMLWLESVRTVQKW